LCTSFSSYVTESCRNLCVFCICFNDLQRVGQRNAVKGEQYIWVYNEDKIRGLRFHRLVKLFKYWTIKDIDRILRFIIIDPQDVEIQ
jgi:hypothetical protein